MIFKNHPHLPRLVLPAILLITGMARAELPDMTSIAAQYAPTVVNISVRGTRKVSTTGDVSSDNGTDAQKSQEEDAMSEFLRGFQQRFV